MNALLKTLKIIATVVLFPFFATYIAYQEWRYNWKLRQSRKGKI